MTKSYNVQVKVRNNYLLTAMRKKGIPHAAALAREIGVSASIVGDMLNLKLSIWHGQHVGRYRVCYEKAAAFFQCTPEDLSPPEHHDNPLRRNVSEAEVSFADMQTITTDPLERIEHREIVDQALDKLRERYRQVLIMRYRDGMNLAEIGEVIGKSQERVRQIEAKGIRMMRHPRISEPLLEIAGLDRDDPRNPNRREDTDDDD